MYLYLYLYLLAMIIKALKNLRKNIQFQLNIDNAAFWFYAIFESKNGYYLILNYTFTITYFEDSLAVIANSLNSITF